MGERTKLGLGISGAASMLGILRAIPWGLNVFLFAPSALATGFLAVALLNALNSDALIVRTNLARASGGRKLDAPYLASLSADAVRALVAALPDLPETDRRTVAEESQDRWATPEAGDWRTYNLSRSRAREAGDASPFAAPLAEAGELRGGR